MSPTEDLTRTWGYSQSKRELEPRWDPSATRELGETIAPNPIGFYSGVSVRGENPPPIPAPAMGTAPTVLTWTGFDPPSAQGSGVFFQLSASVAHELTVEPMRISLRLPNTVVNVKNNARPLDTTYFRTPVKRVTVKSDGTDTFVIIDLKRDATPRVTTKAGSGGYYILSLRFPTELRVEPMNARPK